MRKEFPLETMMGCLKSRLNKGRAMDESYLKIGDRKSGHLICSSCESELNEDQVKLMRRFVTRVRSCSQVLQGKKRRATRAKS